MKAYEVSAGTRGLLLRNPTADHIKGGKWDTEDFSTSKDQMFTEVVVDPVRVYNGNSGIDPNSTPYKLAERGYMVFQHPATDKYLLAVHQYSVNTI